MTTPDIKIEHMIELQPSSTPLTPEGSNGTATAVESEHRIELQPVGAPEIPPLSQLFFYLTIGCNLACRHCWMAPKFDPDGTKFGHLPVKLFKTAIREAMPLGMTGLKLTGGEPLMHPKIVEMLAFIRKHELSLVIETNGLLCSPEMAAEIAKSPRRFVSVSLDAANAKTHDWIRGVPGSFEQTMEAIRNLAAVEVHPQIIMTLMRYNEDQSEDLVRLAEELGASSVKWNVLQPTKRGEKIHENNGALEVEELIDMGHYIDHELSKITDMRLEFDLPMAFRPLSKLATPDGCSRCHIHNILGVIATGRYALCGIGDNIPEMVFGVVGKDRLEDIWHNHKTIKSLRTGLPEKLRGICSNCLMKSVCKGACIAQNFYRTGSTFEPFWVCEDAAEKGLFPESRMISSPASVQ